MSTPPPSTPTPDGLSSVVAKDTLETPSFRWVGLKKLTWKDPNGDSREWECAFRTTRRSECDGVAVVAFVRYPTSKKADEVVLVTQFRPPVGAEVVEAPAGLVDAGEDAAIAAERELMEETGFKGKVTCVSPIVPCDPGMTDANMRYVTIDVDGDAEENQNPKAIPDDGEFITVRRLPASQLQEGLDSLADAGFQVDARLYAMALGYTMGRRSFAAADREITDEAGPGMDTNVSINKSKCCRKIILGKAGFGIVGCALLATALGALIAGSMCPGENGKGSSRGGTR